MLGRIFSHKPGLRDNPAAITCRHNCVDKYVSHIHVSPSFLLITGQRCVFEASSNPHIKSLCRYIQRFVAQGGCDLLTNALETCITKQVNTHLAVDTLYCFRTLLNNTVGNTSCFFLPAHSFFSRFLFIDKINCT
jgi:hypothetical protein